MSAENESFLKDKKIIDAADEASAREALADQPSYACWKMSRTPNAYKELNSSEGKFGQVQATATELKGLKATLNTNDHHVDYAISFSGADNVIKANNVSAATLSTEDGVYGLRHVYGIWRGTSLGFNASENEGNADHFPGLVGQTINRVTWYLTDGSIVYYSVGNDVSIKILPKTDVKVDVVSVDAGTDSTTFTLSEALPQDFKPELSVKDADGNTVGTATLSGTSGTISGLGKQPVGTLTLTISDTSGNFAPISASFSLHGYALMNIPYEQFYAAVGATGGKIAYDAITSATNKAGNYGKSGGAFHSGTTAKEEGDAVTAVGGENGAKNEGVIWPVQYSDSSVLTGENITAESKVTTATLGKGSTSSSYLISYAALTEAPAHSYFLLDQKPDHYLTVSSRRGQTSFGEGTKDNGTAGAASVTDSYGTNWGDVQLSIQGVDDLDGKLINAVVITAKDATGSAIRVPLFHLTNVWSANDMAWKAAQIHGLDGKDIVGITYYCSVKDDTVEAGNNDIPPYANYVYTYTVSGLSIPPVYQGTISAAFSSNSSIRLTGLPDDAVNVKAKVYHSEGRNNTTYLTPLAVDTADQDIDPKSVAVVNNSIPVSPSKVTVTNEKGDSMTYGEPVIDTEYTIELSCDNYILSKVSATYTGTTSGGGGSSSGSSGSSQSSAATEVSTGTAAENGQKVTNTTAAPTASVKDATASTKVSKAMADAIVREAKSHSSDTVVIAPKVSDAATVTRSEITLPDGLVKNLRSQTKADLRIETPAADVTIPYADLRELSSGALSVTTDKTAPDTVSVELAADGKKVENLSAPVLARLDLKDGQVAVLVNPDGTQTVLPKSIVEDGKTLVLLPGSATVQVKDTAKEFPDVKSEVWYADAVDFVSSHGLFLGVQEDTFAPGAEMNRAMLATVLWRLESERAAAFAGQFSDIPAGSWYTSAVAWAQESGIVQGYGDGTFGAEDSITREQLAVMLYRYAKTVGMSTNAAGSISSFSDAGQVSGWAEGALQWAVQTGIVTGTTDGRLNPSGTASRAEVAVMLQRLVREMLR